ncbi:hypothetical protein OOK41_13535 [Micromonospora sp. NBC_01655]|uniref:hypothetical protein n=1 Tax=Micromonospora sp. NBC_01655 TaxID=2975983 RepID=UPI002257E9D1|nr:hypothetical protein [Micromonospora sp. NBC_01655]MCX4471322.1 hypothetical protein [Micromonospora sp. NBC_01655]
MTDQVHHLLDNPTRYYEVLGRVMSALRETGALNGATHLDWWPGNGGRTWEIEWQGGPFPAEAAARLLGVPEAGAGDDGTEHAVRGLVAPGRGSQERAHLVVLDVPVNLRAIDPIGVSQVWATLTVTR